VEAITDPGLLLKITPPKLRKALLVRERLRWSGTADDDVAVILVEAPAGYGKTSLIAQWRLDWLQGGAAVGWLSLDAGDSPVTLVSGIALGLRRSIGRGDFGNEAIQAARRGSGSLSALTTLLAEITDHGRPMALVLDNGERLSDATVVEVIDYLLHNLPPNLRVVMGTRTPVRAETLDLLARGVLRRVKAAELSFNLPEAIHLLRVRLGGRIDADLSARLHEITGGWPLGLQLAAAALERAADPHLAIDEFAKSRDDATQHLFDSLVTSLPSGLGDFVTRCSLLDELHPSLCEAVTGEEDAGLSLQRLLVATPLLSAAEEGEWLRLHPLAREYLRGRAEESLTQEERREIHVQAWHWFAARGHAERAAQHALAAGSRRDALHLVSAVLDHELDQGRIGTVSEWLARMPAEAISSSLQLRVVALWVHAFRFRVDKALPLATAILEDPAVDVETRMDAMAALAGALAMVDRYDEARQYAYLCQADAAGARARHLLAYLDSDFAFNAGRTEFVRRLLSSITDGSASPLVQIWRDFKIVFSYLWEGRPALAEQIARPQLSRWATEVGRRGPWTALIGSVLAAACWQQDMRSDARALLAGRLDVVERGAAYGGVVNAYRTLAQMAASEGDEARALAYLEALSAVGENRKMIRLVATSLAERVRLHAARGRPAQAATALAAMASVVQHSKASDLLAPQIQLELEMAHTYAAVVAGNSTDAGMHVAKARELAARLNRGYEAVQVLALQALLAERAGESPDALLTEALSRAESGGLVRVFADTLPELVELVRRRRQGETANTVTRAFVDRVLAASEPRETTSHTSAPPTGNALLTAKENEVLQLLAGGLLNKQIATELELSVDTVKWHVKKLLAKLNAGSRDHAVDRARMLGLLR